MINVIYKTDLCTAASLQNNIGRNGEADGLAVIQFPDNLATTDIFVLKINNRK